ncbi:hypothetical protein H311_03080 [Anncaliia algerae PRA109]|nr:hypothetical protein H311_03080 [Anncaliia algerae PRA109]
MFAEDSTILVIFIILKINCTSQLTSIVSCSNIDSGATRNKRSYELSQAENILEQHQFHRDAEFCIQHNLTENNCILENDSRKKHELEKQKRFKDSKSQEFHNHNAKKFKELCPNQRKEIDSFLIEHIETFVPNIYLAIQNKDNFLHLKEATGENNSGYLERSKDEFYKEMDEDPEKKILENTITSPLQENCSKIADRRFAELEYEDVDFLEEDSNDFLKTISSSLMEDSIDTTSQNNPSLNNNLGYMEHNSLTSINQEKHTELQEYRANTNEEFKDFTTKSIENIHEIPIHDEYNAKTVSPFEKTYQNTFLYAYKQNIPPKLEQLITENSSIRCIRIIEEDNSLDLLYLINRILNRKVLERNQHKRFYPSCYQAYDDFYKILSLRFTDESFQGNLPIGYKYLYNKFIHFKIWIENTYKMKSLLRSKHCYVHLKQYNKILNSRSDNNIIDIYINIFKSKNYSFLYKVLPGLNLLSQINEYLLLNSRKVYLIRHLQLIICKFEVFRHNYFQKNMKESENLHNLNLDETFCETITILNCIFKKITIFIDLGEEIHLILEIYNFVNFIRTKYSYFFCRYPLLERILNENLFENEKFFKELQNCDLFLTVKQGLQDKDLQYSSGDYKLRNL